MTPIVLWGATGQARVLQEFLPRIGYNLVALFDNDITVTSPFPGVPLFHGQAGFKHWKAEWGNNCAAACLVAVGGDRGRERLELQRYLEDKSLLPIVAIHPTAFVAATARLSKGCQVLARAAVCADAVLGEACIINTGAIVDHETTLGAGVHVAPGAVLAGSVTVGANAFIGAGAVILPRLNLGADCVIGAGSVVTHDIPDASVVYGNQGRIRRTAAPELSVSGDSRYD